MTYLEPRERDVKLRITMPSGTQSVITVGANADNEINIILDNDGNIRVEGGYS